MGSIWDVITKNGKKQAPKASNESGKGYSSAPRPKAKSSNESGMGYSYSNAPLDAKGNMPQGSPLSAGYKPVQSPISSGMGASAPVGVSPVTEVTQANPTGIDLNALYAAVGAKIQGMGDTAVAAYDPALQKVKDAYGLANQDLQAMYGQNSGAVSNMAAGLGVSADPYTAAWNQQNRRIEENSNQSQADAETFFNKMKAARQQMTDQALASLEAQKLQAQQEQSLAILDYLSAQEAGKKGSGGGGGGSGDSSSGTIKETATLTETLANPFDTEIYNGLLASDPTAAALYRNYALQATGDPTTKMAAAEYNKLVNTPDVKPTTSIWNINKFWAQQADANKQNAEKQKKIKTTGKVVNASAAKGSGTFGAPKQAAKVVTTGSKKKPQVS